MKKLLLTTLIAGLVSALLRPSMQIPMSTAYIIRILGNIFIPRVRPNVQRILTRAGPMKGSVGMHLAKA